MAAIGPDEYRRLLERAAITPEKPLHAVLMASFQAATEARDAAKGNARDLAEAAVDAVAREIDRLMWWQRIGTLAKGALIGAVLLGAGYAVGRWEATVAPVLPSVELMPPQRGR